MKIKCDYCSNTYEDTLPECPDCGARNPVQKSVSDKDPRTIEGLQKWYEARNLPPYEVTRFFIGIDYRDPKAFGIYTDADGDIVVYKNKADGSRAIRYKGGDEAYAVNELFQKLKDEIVHQKALNGERTSKGNTKQSSFGFYILIAVIAAPQVLLTLYATLLFISAGLMAKDNGYYVYDDKPYYKDGGNWYVYDTVDNFDYDIDTNYPSYDWTYSSEPSEYSTDVTSREDHYYGKDYNQVSDWVANDAEFSEVKDSDAWSSAHSSNHDDSDYSSSDYSWSGSDSWDSGGTDWSSDW